MNKKADVPVSKAKIFFSYSHKDESLREQLNTHLSILKRNGLIEEWHDRKILPGQLWESEIDKNLYESDIVLLLVSSDFIDSEYCYGNELTKAIERHEANQSIVIPIIIRPVNWSDAPFAKLQALPKDAKAVTSWLNIDEAWLDVSEGIQKAIGEISTLKKRTDKSAGLKPVRDLLLSEVEAIDQRFQTNSTSSGIPTGLIDLDQSIDGLHAGDLVVLASRPENGVGDLALTIASRVAIDSGLPVAYFSFQLPANRLTQRLICIIGGLNPHDLIRGALDDHGWIGLTTAIGKLNDAPFFIEDSNTLSLTELISNVKHLKSNQGLSLIVIDSIQSLYFQTGSEHTAETYSKSLKRLAKELQIPIVLTSNLSPELEQRPDKRPVIRDLADWRVLEEDADIIIFSYVDNVYDWDSAEKGSAELLIAKNSYGPVGTIITAYESDSRPFFESYAK